ncbi:glycosyltransferase family 4 protein [Lascolabacillus massiliensis]|uniref:glycosyltransferase family 4 protein n=1 Tax=Lascolabacillus massiliensis TaxID=1627894 RepID=UPI001E633814|nr:glycosyltransferase family 4 protein [Lascolabacillus massiliensis]
MELSKQCGEDCHIDVVTTQPNRYSSFKVEAKTREDIGNMSIHRIDLPSHKSGMLDQVRSFRRYFAKALKITRNEKYDLVFASSSRLFTAYLGLVIARKQKIPLYLDIRDIFVDTIDDVLKNKLVKTAILPFLKVIEKRTFSYASHINLISEGFKPYFKKYNNAKYSFFTNGIDDVFLNNNKSSSLNASTKKTITYAGNIGEGQGLHKIIPQVASQLGPNYQFKVIGDGGAKKVLEDEIAKLGLKNVDLIPPVTRERLLEIYNGSDFLFLHLNVYEAFEKVLPSKIFELATFDKPIIAGVGGYANKFITENVSNTILFNPCDVDAMVSGLQNYTYINEKRTDFIAKFSRNNINREMAKSILSYL